MSSSEEYLENLLQAMMNGEVAKPSEDELDSSDKPKSAIEMLTGEEPENAETEEIFEDESVSIDEITDDIVMSNDDVDLETLSLPEDLNIDEIILSENSEMEELNLDDMSELADPDLQDILESETVESEGGLFEEGVMDEMVLEEPEIPSIDLENSGLDDVAVDENGLDDVVLDSVDFDDIALEESGMEEMLVEETGPEDVAMEGAVPDDVALDDAGFDDIALEESGMEEMLVEETGPEDAAVEESGLDDIVLEESGLDDIALEGSDLDDIVLEESGLDDVALEGSDLGDIALDGEGLDDIVLEESGLDDIALDESGFDEMSNDVMDGSSDDDFGELDDLLDQAGQDDEIDDEMLALLESVSDSEGDDPDGMDGSGFDLFQDDEDKKRSAELNDLIADSEETEEQPQESKKKRKERKRGRKKAKGTDVDTEQQDEIAGKDGKNSSDSEESGVETQKKPGFFARFLAYLTESEEDEEIEKENVSLGELSDENQELLAELSDEDKQSDNEKAKEKEKEEKKKKGKKEKKGKKNKKADSSDEEGGGESEKAKKKRLKKEQKKAAKEAAKAAKAEAESVDVVPDKKLSKKKVTPVILFCATITVVIILLATVLPSFLQKRDARVAFDMGNYEETFDLLYGKNLDEEDEVLLHKSTIIMTLERKLASYRNYQKLADMELEALDALVQGVALYNELLPQAGEYNVTGEIEDIYQEILETLSTQYGLSETDVIVILDSEDDATYTRCLTSIVYGISFDDGIGAEEEEEEQPESAGIEDILPEEQEIIDGLSDEADAGES